MDAAGAARARAWAGLRAGAADLLGLAVPVDCVGCGTPDATVCARCLVEVTSAPRRVVAPRLPPGLPVWTGPEYDDVVARIVVGWKERGRHDAVRVLGDALAVGPLTAALATLGALPAPPVAPVLLVPVPASRAAVRARGEHHVRRLALRAADRLRRLPAASSGSSSGSSGLLPGSLPVRVADVLRVRPGVADQAGLGSAARARNLRDAFALRRGADVDGRLCVVLDDVLTTGATLAAAVRVLDAAGALPVAVCTLSATPLRRGLSALRQED